MLRASDFEEFFGSPKKTKKTKKTRKGLFMHHLPESRTLAQVFSREFRRRFFSTLTMAAPAAFLLAGLTVSEWSVPNVSAADAANAADPAVSCPLKDSVFVEAESFQEKGGWVVDQQFMDIKRPGDVGSVILLAHGMGKPVANAKTTVTLPKAGTRFRSGWGIRLRRG